MPFCKTCDQYESVHVKHECPPKWYAMDADEGDPEDIVDCPPFLRHRRRASCDSVREPY